LNIVLICYNHLGHEIGKIVHRDIHANNLLISDDDTLKLSDFELSCIITDDDDSVPCDSGPSTYTPPEKIMNSSTYGGRAADMWLIGATLYHMIFKKPLFQKFGKLTPDDYM
jgi:serine/threonine protein kinase